jgi:hypothetical protein
MNVRGTPFPANGLIKDFRLLGSFFKMENDSTFMQDDEEKQGQRGLVWCYIRVIFSF